MPERRMFSQKIVQSDAFMDLPLSTQALYFHLGIEVKNKGFLRNAKAISRLIGASKEDLQLLIDKGYLKPLEEGGFFMVDYYENNGVGETHKKRNNYTYRKWRQAVLERDGFACRACGSTQKLQAHHVKDFAKYPLLRFEIDNGVTLCETCHRKLHKGMRRKGGE